LIPRRWRPRRIRSDHLEALVGELADRAVIEASRLARYTELCADLPARPGISKWIIEAHALGLKLGVATNDDNGVRHEAAGGEWTRREPADDAAGTVVADKCSRCPSPP
jgi:hypothetical protein